MKRHEMRRLALQALYQVDVGKAEVVPAVDHVLAESDGVAAEHERKYILTLTGGVRSQVIELDDLLETHVQGWKIDRIARVDLNILRLALYELLYQQDVDFATVVDEAVELAKHFSTEESGKFVNGVLARLLPIAQERR
ncbi:MAG: transcription antitermination factor NusB [Alicyclobacillus sp. RIFOXYA1_FULL_53_8]|nr:MAG: transcription antitermination factor NusB [Alicyclobacillus sp. RIFOXYA1_FULL_53_8]